MVRGKSAHILSSFAFRFLYKCLLKYLCVWFDFRPLSMPSYTVWFKRTRLSNWLITQYLCYSYYFASIFCVEYRLLKIPDWVGTRYLPDKWSSIVWYHSKKYNSSFVLNIRLKIALFICVPQYTYNLIQHLQCFDLLTNWIKT